MHRGMGALFWLGGADAHMLDTEGWWSVTPEILATHQSSLCKRYSRGHVALDAMAGCAGNAIQLTKDFSVVYAVEISKRRADMARNNAEVYGVGSQVEVRRCDVQVLVQEEAKPAL
eukprot:scaffold168976_cov21-Tisochrysis_lutea.AAC.5